MNAVVSSPTVPSPQPQDVAAKPHHNKKGKGFINPWPSYRDFGGPKILGKIIWQRITGEWKNPDTTPPTVRIQKPVFLQNRHTERLRATWLGHACYYVEFPLGLRVLFDPVFTERCSPFTFLGPKRYTEMPCQIEDMPYIDAVVISHNHYDHLSHPTIQQIARKFPNTHFFVPLGNKPWFKHMGLDDSNVTELDWWEERTLTLSPTQTDDTKQDDITATFSCLPCQHTSARTAFDKAHTLWASWSVSSGGKIVYFGGDTGYRTVPELPKDEFDYGEKYADLPHCPAFSQIGELKGPFDLGLIPIGAYDPRYIMSPMHANPYDSVNIFADTRCKRALGIHWGTWVLTTEEVMAPPRVLKEALKWKGLSEEVFETCEIGESREYEITKRTKKSIHQDGGENLLMALPAELRNSIYEMVLLSDEPVFLGSVKTMCRMRQSYGSWSETWLARRCSKPRPHLFPYKGHCTRLQPWREPGILRSSQAIRAEASAMYYCSNAFEIRVLMEDFHLLAGWLETLAARVGTQLFTTVRVHVCKASIAGVYLVKPLVLALHRNRIVMKPEEYRSGVPADLLRIDGGNYQFLQRQLAAAVSFGRTAAEQGWTASGLEELLDSWAKGLKRY